jgi:spore germination cell wall hydrolase CwlJ-like protein
MNRLKGIRPAIFLSCLVIAIALVMIYSISSAITIDDKPDKEIRKSLGRPDKKVLSVGQVSKSITDAESEEQREQFMVASEDQYIASRGEYDRLAEPKPAAPAAKPAAPAAPAKTKAAPVKTAAKAASQSDGDVDVLARLIMAEAQAEPYEAKVAVGAVVINRVQSGQWAGSIKGVIYQKSGGYYQFTPVQNGWINKPADAECIRAAKAALNGADPTGGAQFYYDDSVTNEWILAKPVSTQIGHMTYAY